MLPPLPKLSEYGISPETGFLPEEEPLSHLPDAYYQPWETIIQNLQALILAKRIRQVVDRMPLLSVDRLRTEREWRRAYVILGFLTHSYIWGGERPADVS
jgi:indoleamine 2,3-dioxygenase